MRGHAPAVQPTTAQHTGEKAERHRAGIAQEHAGWRHVVRQEARGRAGHAGGEQR